MKAASVDLLQVSLGYEHTKDNFVNQFFSRHADCIHGNNIFDHLAELYVQKPDWFKLDLNAEDPKVLNEDETEEENESEDTVILAEHAEIKAQGEKDEADKDRSEDEKDGNERTDVREEEYESEDTAMLTEAKGQAEARAVKARVDKAKPKRADKARGDKAKSKRAKKKPGQQNSTSSNSKRSNRKKTRRRLSTNSDPDKLKDPDYVPNFRIRMEVRQQQKRSMQITTGSEVSDINYNEDQPPVIEDIPFRYPTEDPTPCEKELKGDLLETNDPTSSYQVKNVADFQNNAFVNFHDCLRFGPERRRDSNELNVPDIRKAIYSVIFSKVKNSLQSPNKNEEDLLFRNIHQLILHDDLVRVFIVFDKYV